MINDLINHSELKKTIDELVELINNAPTITPEKKLTDKLKEENE